MRVRSRSSSLRACAALACALASVFLVDVRAADADPSKNELAAGPRVVGGSPLGASYLQALGRHAQMVVAPNSTKVGALVLVPQGKTPQEYGLEPAGPRLGRIRTTPAKLEAFGIAHPETRVEVGPQLRPLMDNVGQWVRSVTARAERGADGTGVYIGVADTGLDVTSPEMVDELGRSRIAWMLDLSLEPLGEYPDLEQKFGIADGIDEKVSQGAVLDRNMINTLLRNIQSGKCVEKTGTKCSPSDESGHGTHVTGIATARGANPKLAGVAPNADIVFVRLYRARSQAISNDDLSRAVRFVFDRAEADKKPTVINISLGADFGPHDGSSLWEQEIASFVGPDHPGRAVVAAAGNVGSIAVSPIHQSVRVTPGARMRVPVRTRGAESGSVQIWVTMRDGANVKMGLEGPDEEWIAPVAYGHQNARNRDEYNAGVIYGPGLEGSPVAEGSNSGVVVWAGKWPSGTYNVTLEGSGMAELYLQGIGDVSAGTEREASFTHGVREGTVNLPATHPSIIAVGCTVNRKRWTAISGAELGPRVPILDQAGGIPLYQIAAPDTPAFRDLIDGEICSFSSAGPTLKGVPKPEIAAPGALVVSLMSQQAKPGTVGSIFTDPSCPPTKSGRADVRCLQVDENHGIANGTSMSSPVVAGVVALLLQKDPTLTQDKIVALLQGGAHRFRGDAPFADQSGPGEVDAVGALDALDQMRNPSLQLPALEQSWVVTSADYVTADGSTPLTAIIELRTADGQHRADFFDKNRLQPVLLVDGQPVTPAPELVRRGPGVWFFLWRPKPGMGGSRATFGATFDGVPVVAPKSLAIASDGWNALYPSQAKGGGCDVAARGIGDVGPSSRTSLAGVSLVVAGVVAGALRRRRSRRRL